MPNFNTYSGYPYGNAYQPVMPQHNYNNMMQNQQQMPQANNYFYVNGVIGAKSFQLQPNQTVMLMDSDSPMCYMKQANSMGQSTLRYFKLVEVSENEINSDTESKANTEYVLKADFEALCKRMDELSSLINKDKNKSNEVVNNG